MFIGSWVMAIEYDQSPFFLTHVIAGQLLAQFLTKGSKISKAQAFWEAEFSWVFTRKKWVVTKKDG